MLRQLFRAPELSADSENRTGPERQVQAAEFRETAGLERGGF
jgi:hypothetical protein